MNDITYEDICQANENIPTMDFQRRQRNQDGSYSYVTNKYVQVKDRVMAFRKLCPEGRIETELWVSSDSKYVSCEARIYDERNLLLAMGHAREPNNKDFGYESAETSAIGRALGFCGIGISTSIASVEEMERTESPSGIFDEPIINKKDLANEFRQLFDVKKQAEILNGWNVTKPEDLEANILNAYVTKKKNER